MADLTFPEGFVPVPELDYPEGFMPVPDKKESLSDRARSTAGALAKDVSEADIPSLGARAWAHAREGFSENLTGAVAQGVAAGGIEAAEIRRLQNQIKMYQANPGFLGGPDEKRIAMLKQKIAELSGTQQQKQQNEASAEAARKTEYANMPPAQGPLENTAAVVGHIAGSLASPETFLGVPELGAAKAAVQSSIPLLQKAGAVAKEALTGGAQMGAVTGGTNLATQGIKVATGLQDKFSGEDFATSTAAGALGGTVLTAIFGQFAKPIVQKALSPAEEAVRANRADRVAAMEAKAAGDTSTGFITRIGQEIEQGMFNWWSPLLRIQKEAGMGKTVLDKPVDELKNQMTKLYPADEFQLLRGTSSQVKIALEEGTFKLNEFGNDFEMTSQDSLLKILKDLGPNANSFLEYVAALRSAYAEETRGIKTGFDRARTNEIIAGFAPRARVNDPAEAALRDQMNSSLARYKAWTDWILDYKKDSGIYSLEDTYRILQENPAFIPFYHIDPTTGEVKAVSSMGKDKLLKGSDLTTNDLAQNLVTYLSRSLEAANKNRAKQSLFDLIDTMPGGDKWATKKTDVFKMTADDIRAALMQDPSVNVATKNALPGMDMSDLRSIYFRKTLKGNEEVVYRDGVANIYVVHDKALVNALSQLTPKQLWVSKLSLKSISDKLPDWGVSELKGAFTSLVTHNPAFAVFTNPVRDAAEAFATGKNTNIPVWAQIKSMWEIAQKDPKLQEFYANGGGYASLATIERNTNLNKMYAQAGIDFKKDVLNDDNSIKALKDHFMSMMEQAELASRYSEFGGLTEKGVPKRISALAAREVTTDFGGHGYWPLIQNFNAVTPFLSATLNATRRLGRVLDSERAMTTAAYSAPILTAAISAYAYNQMYFQKEYDAQPDWLKQTHILIGYPKWDKERGMVFGGFAALPLSQGIGYTFGSLPRAFVEAGQKGDYNIIAKALRTYLMNTFNVAELPPSVGMAEAVGATAGLVPEENLKTFTGSSVVPKKLQNVDKRFQSTPQTSSYMVDLGEKMGMSPILLQNMITSFTLYLGDLGLAIMERFTKKREEMGRGTMPRPNWQDVPFLGRMIKDAPPKYGPADEEFYRLTKMVSKETDTMNLSNTRLDFMRTYEQLKKVDPKYGQMKDLNPTITDIQKQVHEIDTAIDFTWLRKDLTPDAKRAELNKYGWERSMLMSSAIEQLVQIPAVKAKLRPQGVGPFMKTLWSGAPEGYAEGGRVNAEGNPIYDYDPNEPELPEIPQQFIPGQPELKAGPEETVGGSMTAAMNAGLTGRSHPDVGPRSFLLPLQYNEFTGQYEWAMPGVMDAFPIGGGPVPAGGATSRALIGIERFPKLYHGTRNVEAVEKEGFRKGKSAERNKPGTSTSADPHVSTLTFSDSPEGLFEVKTAPGPFSENYIDPKTQVRNIDPFTYAIAADAEEIPGVLAEKKPFYPYKEDEIFFKGKKQKLPLLDTDKDGNIQYDKFGKVLTKPLPKEDTPLTGQNRLYPQRNEQTKEVALAARKRAVQLDDLNGEIYKGFKNNDERYALESSQKAWKLAKGYPRLESRVIDEGLPYLELPDFTGAYNTTSELTTIRNKLDNYKMHKRAYDDFIEKTIRPNKAQLKKAVDKNKWNLASKEDITIPQMKKNLQESGDDGAGGYYTKYVVDTQKPPLSVRELATETNARYRAMMRAKYELTQAIEKADPSKISPKKLPQKDDKFSKTTPTVPKGWENTGLSDFNESVNTPNANYEYLKDNLPLAHSDPDPKTQSYIKLANVEFDNAKNFFKEGNKQSGVDYLHSAFHAYLDAMSNYANPKTYTTFHENLKKAGNYILNGFTDTQQAKLINAVDNPQQLLSMSKKELNAILNLNKAGKIHGPVPDKLKSPDWLK